MCYGFYDVDEDTQEMRNGPFSWERKTAKGYNHLTAKQTKRLARELYGDSRNKLEYAPELVDRSGW